MENRFIEIFKMGVNLEGIHFHCGSGQHGSDSFSYAINTAMRCIEIGRKVGHKMSILDMGGGFPSGDLSADKVEALSQTKDRGVNISAEPGRHFSNESCHLAMRVIGKRKKYGKDCYHLNDSLYHSLNNIIMDGFSLENTVN